MGEVPEAYPLMVAAERMGVAPWDLARQPSVWMHLALAFMDAEEHARKMAERRQGRGRSR